MSAPPRQPVGKVAPSSKANLLAYMKLRSPNDLIVHEKISEWVALQQLPAQIPPAQTATCRISSALLLLRLVRAFEQRLNTVLDDPKKKKGGGPTTSSPSKQGHTINAFGSSVTNGGRNDLSKKVNQSSKSPSKTKPPADLHVLMQRKVKVTRLVQQAVQFVGSDVLKVLQVLAHSPTVSDVANACLTILKDVSRIKKFYAIFAAASGKDPSTVDQASSTFFGVFALQALQSLRAQAISAYELAHDFDLIYRTCYQDQAFQDCVNALNPIITPAGGVAPTTAFAPDTEARNICWKITRVLALKLDYASKSDPEAKDHRRNHILSSAASIVLAANMGKSMMSPSAMNGKVTEAARSGLMSSSSGKPDSPSPAKRQKLITVNETDFVALVAGPVSELLHFISKNTFNNQGITPIYKADIRSQLDKIFIMINHLPVVQKAASNSIISRSTNLPPLLSKAFLPPRLHFVLNNYRSIIHTLVMDTQKELKINTAANSSNAMSNSSSGANARTGIVNVLLLFPMVIGEPWGIHRDAPMIASKMLCPGEYKKPAPLLKDSVAVVMKLKPKEVMKKPMAAGISDLARTTTKKTTTTDPIEIITVDSPLPTTRAPVEVRMGEIKPPVMNDSTELNEWTLSILSLSVVKPSDALLTYLGENDRMEGTGSSCLQDVIIPVLNRGVLRIQGALHSLSNIVHEEITTKLTIGRRDGQVYVNGQVDHSIQLCASVVGFYYHSLEAIIQDQMDRMEFLGTFDSLLQSRSFHRALLACCYTCVLKGIGTTQKLHMNKNYKNITVQILMDTIESNPFTFLKIIEALCRALIVTDDSPNKQLGSPIVAGLPFILQQHIQTIETQLIDNVVWNTLPSPNKTEASLMATIKTMRSLPGTWPPDILEPILPEEIINGEVNSSKVNEVRYKPSFGASSEANFLSFFLRKLLKCAFSRIQDICAALNLSNETLVHTQILVSFRYLLRHHITIFYERHVDQLLLCSIYGVCRLMRVRPEITFGKIIDAYFAVRGEDQGERACRLIVRHVKLVSSEKGNRPDMKVVGNIVVFYNQTYVPKMQKYFLGSKSLKQSTTLYQKRLANQRKSVSKEQKKQNTPEKRKLADNSSRNSSTATIARSSDSKKNPLDGKLTNKSLVEKDSSKASSVEKTGSSSKGNSSAINSASLEKKTTINKPNCTSSDGKNASTVSKVKDVSLTGKADASISPVAKPVAKPLSINSKQHVSANSSATGSAKTAYTEKTSGNANGVSSDLKKQPEQAASLGDKKVVTSGEKSAIAVKEKSTSGEQSKDAMDVEDSTKTNGKEDAMDVKDSTKTDGKVDAMDVDSTKTNGKEDAMEIEDSTKTDGKTASTNSSDGHEKPGKSVGEKSVSNESGSKEVPTPAEKPGSDLNKDSSEGKPFDKPVDKPVDDKATAEDKTVQKTTTEDSQKRKFASMGETNTSTAS
ncbi:MAG: hypothetical protein ACI90V_003823 [Bacillariaceae sp.]|jgi:hypothetical protein